MSRRKLIAVLPVVALLAVLAASPASAAVGWSDGSPQFQSTANCSGLVGAHGSTIGQWRDPQSSAYPIPGERYYGRISIGVGPTCTGTDTFRYFTRLPANTQLDPGSDADGKVRCWYNTTPSNPNTWVEITGQGLCIEPQNAGNGWWDLGVVTLGVGWAFEVHFPLRSTQTLGGNAVEANVFSGAGGPNAMWPTFPVTVYGAPVTSINSGPSGTTNNTSPNFSFSANKQVQGFECRLDSGAYGACSSPKAYSGLGNGQHTFRVRALSQGGSATAETTRTWTIDSVAPTATINSGPSGTTQQTSASFGFSSSEAGSSFECRIDSGAYGACSSPKAYSGLSDGAHTFQVRATDAAGNVGNAATRNWTVDSTGATVPPTTTISSGPSGTTNETTATFGFTSSKPSSTFECQAAGGSLPARPFEPCSSPKAYTGLADGVYTFKVRATAGGLLGNTATRQWTVNTTGGSGGGGTGGGGTGGGGDDGGGSAGDGSAAACTAAQDKVKSAKKKLKRAKKSGKAAKVKKAKKKLKKAKTAQRNVCS
jgi:hypothetical protein